MSAPINVTIKDSRQDWIEVIVNEKRVFLGHPGDLEHEDLLRAVFIEPIVVEDAPMAPDGRSFL